MHHPPNIGQRRIVHPSNAAVVGLAVLLSLGNTRALAQDTAASGLSDDAAPTRCLGERTLARARASDAQWTAFRSSNVVVPPLLWLSSDRSFAMAAMLYWHSASVARGTNLHLFAPLLFYRCTPEHRAFGSPLLGYRRDADGLAGFAGLYFFRRDREARTDALFPLMLHSLDHGRRTLTLLNGYWHRTARGHHAGFIPLLFWGRSDAYRYGGVLPPLIWFGRDRDSSTSMVLPFYRRRDDTAGRTRTGVLPLYFRVRSHAYAHDVLFPLFWRYRGANWRAGLIGQSYWLRDPNVHTFGSFPFYMGRRDRDGRYLDITLPALFARAGKGEDKFIWALNTLWSTEQTGDYELDVIPLLVARRKGSVRSVYSWLAIRTADEQSTTTVVPPLLLGWGARPDGRWVLVGPAFLRTREAGWRGGFLPLYWGNHGRTHYADTVPALLFSRWGSGSERSGWMFGPVYRRIDAGLSAWGVAPLFAQRRQGDALLRMFTPLVFRSKTPSERTTTVLPLAWYRRTGDLRKFISPLVLHYDRKSSQTRRTTLFPLVWYRASPARTSDVFAPFWWHFERRDEGKRLSLLFPLGFRRSTPEERTWLALNTVYTRGAGSNSGAWSFHFFPLLNLSRFHADHFKWQVLMGMLGHERDAQRHRWRALWIWTDPA